MNGIDIAVIVLVSVSAIAVLGVLIYKKIKRKGGCCGCGEGCAYCSGCDKSKKK